MNPVLLPGEGTIEGVSKVLIVEDDAVIARAMATHLSAGGFDPVWVANGETGVARLRFERPTSACST